MQVVTSLQIFTSQRMTPRNVIHRSVYLISNQMFTLFMKVKPKKSLESDWLLALKLFLSCTLGGNTEKCFKAQIVF